jgi:hypothetical protein
MQTVYRKICPEGSNPSLTASLRLSYGWFHPGPKVQLRCRLIFSSVGCFCAAYSFLFFWRRFFQPVLCCRKRNNRKNRSIIGSIAYVDEARGFVLIDVGGIYLPQPGIALKSYAQSNETAVLTVSPEQKRPFITADIVKGLPQKGDDVYE